MTNAQWLVKLITEELAEASVPMSTWRIKWNIWTVIRQRSLTPDNELIRLVDASDITNFLTWMSTNGMVRHHKFVNRKSDYWSIGLFACYPYMNDQIDDDNPESSCFS